jgi:biopolymer transport protein ExbD
VKNKVLQSNVASGEVSFNVVPLVDCIFLMIIFFILTSQMADPNIMGTVFLASPEKSMGVDSGEKTMKNKLIINVISDEPVEQKTGKPVIDARKAGIAKSFAIGTRNFSLQDVEALAEAFKEKKAIILKTFKPEEFCLVIRCDWRVRFQDVVPIFEAAARAGIPKMNITVNKS